MNDLKTLGQKRSSFALKMITKYSKVKSEFKNFVVGAPSMILQNGFGQTLAFWASKGKDQHLFVLYTVTKWLKEMNMSKSENYKELIEELSNNFSQKEYLIAQKEAIAMLEWLKRYAKAFWEEEKEENSSANH